MIDNPPVALLDYLEAKGHLVAFSRRVLACWLVNRVLVTLTLTRLPSPAAALRSRAGVTEDAVRFSALVCLRNVTGQLRSRCRCT